MDTTHKRPDLFQAFDALKGFGELLKQQEIPEENEVYKEEPEVLDYLIHQLKVGDIITVTYQKDKHYYQMTGKIAKLNLDTKMIQIVKTVIPLTKIVAIALPE